MRIIFNTVRSSQRAKFVTNRTTMRDTTRIANCEFVVDVHGEVNAVCYGARGDGDEQVLGNADRHGRLLLVLSYCFDRIEGSRMLQ